MGLSPTSLRPSRPGRDTVHHYLLSARAVHQRRFRRGDRRQLAPLDVGHVHRRPQGRRRGAVGVGGRADRVPEAAGPTDDPHRRGAARHVVADADVPGRRRLAGRDGARRTRASTASPRTRGSRSAASSCATSGSTGWPALGCSPTTLVPRLSAMVRCGFTILVSRPAGRRQDDAADRAARRGVATRADHHRREEPARAAARGRPAPSRRAGAVHPPRQRRGRRRDHDPPARRADAAPQPRPRRRRRARRGRGARHARRRIDVQARLAGDHPRPRRRRRAAAPRLLRVEVEHAACPSSPCGA